MRLPPIAGGWIQDSMSLGGTPLQLTRPADPDALLESNLTEPQPRAPYWGILWPAAQDMAAWLLRKPSPMPAARETTALELGCGLGWVGLAALRAGVSVTFSDHEPLAVTLALHNAAQNGLPNAKGLQLDWHAAENASAPAADTAADTAEPAAHPNRRYPLILGCDLLYETTSHAALLHTLRRYLLPGGRCLLGDPFRSQAPGFCRAAIRCGFRVHHLDTVGPVACGKPCTAPSAHGRAHTLGRTQILLLEASNEVS